MEDIGIRVRMHLSGPARLVKWQSGQNHYNAGGQVLSRQWQDMPLSVFDTDKKIRDIFCNTAVDVVFPAGKDLPVPEGDVMCHLTINENVAAPKKAPKPEPVPVSVPDSKEPEEEAEAEQDEPEALEVEEEAEEAEPTEETEETEVVEIKKENNDKETIKHKTRNGFFYCTKCKKSHNIKSRSGTEHMKYKE